MLSKREYDLEQSLEQDDQDLMDAFLEYEGSTNIGDAISEIADSHVGIYNNDILENARNLYSSGAYESASSAGLMGDGKDLIKNLQSAWYFYNEQHLNNNLQTLIHNYAVNYMQKNSIHLKESFAELLQIHLEDNIDSNCAFDDIEDAVKEVLKQQNNFQKSEPSIRELLEKVETIEEKNYILLSHLTEGIFEGENDYFKFKSEGMMNLVVERIAPQVVTILHYYVQNGDLMRDPEITLRFDNEKRTVEPLTFQQDNLGIYQVIDSSEQKDVSSFLNAWLDNIQQQNYIPFDQENSSAEELEF